jgi:hypothetical protein
MRRAAALCLFAGMMLPAAPLAHAVSLSLVPSSPVISVGQSVLVDVVISDLTASGLPALRSFDFDIAFHDGLLDFDPPVSFGLLLGDPGLLEALTSESSGPGVVDLAEVSLLSTGTLDSLQTTESFVLATLSFTGVAEGSAMFSFAQALLGDENGGALDPGGDIPGVSIDVVPEPGSAALLLLGLGWLGRARGIGARR